VEIADMPRKPLALSASLLALMPAAASAADVQLGGAPTLRLVDAHHAQLRFASDRLPRRADGALDARITFAGGQRVTGLRPVGRHGKDVVYAARVTSRSALRVGTKYTVRIRIDAQAPIVRKVKLLKRGG
jgi:hypothetical protein